jgi:hypothetical protein
MGEIAHATMYYVDRNLPGSDSNNGTSESAPFLTFQRCVAAARSPGDTCLIKNGTYIVPSTGIQISQSGASGNPITFKNYPGHTPVLTCTDWTVPSCQIYLQAAGGGPVAVSWLVFEGLEFTKIYYALRITNASNVIIRNNHIRNTYYSGIQGNGYRVTIERNRIHDNGDKSLVLQSQWQYGLYLVGQAYTITNNLFYSSTGYCAQLAGYPFNSSAMPNANYAGFSGKIANNVCAYNMNTAGMVVWNNGGPVTGITIDNNIFFQPCLAPASRCSGTGRGGIQFLSAGAAGTLIRNNVFYDTDCPTGNCFISGDGTQGSTYILQSNSATVNPNMVNASTTLPASPDFHLTSGSVAIDVGFDLSASGVTTDFSGNTRPVGNGYDVGAYEYSSNGARPAAPLNLQVK